LSSVAPEPDRHHPCAQAAASDACHPGRGHSTACRGCAAMLADPVQRPASTLDRSWSPLRLRRCAPIIERHRAPALGSASRPGAMPQPSHRPGSHVSGEAKIVSARTCQQRLSSTSTALAPHPGTLNTAHGSSQRRQRMSQGCRQARPAGVAKTMRARRGAPRHRQGDNSCKLSRKEGLRPRQGIHVHALASRAHIATCNAAAAAG